MEAVEETLDLRGLKCPLPALLARRHLSHAPAGAVLVVLTDDPMAPIDVPFMCGHEGIEVIEVTREGDNARITLRKPRREENSIGR